MSGCNFFHVPPSKRHRIISVAVLALPAAGLESCHLLTRSRRVDCRRAIHWRPHVGLCRRFLHVHTDIRYCTLGCWDPIFGYPPKGHGREDLCGHLYLDVLSQLVLRSLPHTKRRRLSRYMVPEYICFFGPLCLRRSSLESPMERGQRGDFRIHGTKLAPGN